MTEIDPITSAARTIGSREGVEDMIDRLDRWRRQRHRLRVAIVVLAALVLAAALLDLHWLFAVIPAAIFIQVFGIERELKGREQGYTILIADALRRRTR